MAAMTRSSTLQVLAGTAQALSPQQKKFNSLMQRIAKKRDLLRDWEAAILLFHQRYSAEVLPLEQQEQQVKLDLLRLFDRLSEQKLAKTDRAYLQEKICHYVDVVLPAVEDEAERDEIKAIFNRHSPMDYDTEQAELERERDAVARLMMEDLFGVEPDEGEPVTPDVMARKLQEHLEQQAQQRQQAREDAASKKRNKKPSARELRQQEAQQQISQSLREIYRKLVSGLHPDRETDPAERERKTALMQRVNQAYDAGQLLQLLELQLEIEQIDAEHIAGLGEERLKHYNQVLAEQEADLTHQVEVLKHSFLEQYQMSPFENYTPKKIGAMMSEDLAGLQKMIVAQRDLLELLTAYPDMFKRWLKDDRAMLSQYEREMRERDPFDF